MASPPLLTPTIVDLGGWLHITKAYGSELLCSISGFDTFGIKTKKECLISVIS
jgi:hypothetical protein